MRKDFSILSSLGVLLVTLVAASCPGQTVDPLPVSHNSTFRIGYVRQDPEAITTSGVYENLRAFLESQPLVQSTMKANGIESILTPSFDSHHLLVEAMDANQVDIAFCSALDLSYQRGNYEPVFQMRRPGDPHSSAGDRRVWHSGTIFVSNRCPLFHLDTSSTLEAMPAYVMEHGIAMIGSSSAAGYLYPYLALDRLTTTVPVISAPSDFRDSSSEVIKAVVNGLYDVGACDSSAINEVLDAHGLLPYKNKLIKEVLRTDPVPRDPIVLSEKWVLASPYSPGKAAELGREMTRAISAYFRQTPGLPILDRTTREPFVEVTENLERFRQRRGEAENK